VVGIDLSREMLEQARRRVARERLRNVVGLLEMDAERTAFADGSFDVAVAMFTATVVPDARRLFREMRRVVRPGGELLFVNHFAAERGLRWWAERTLAPLSRVLGWHPDFALTDCWTTRAKPPRSRSARPSASSPWCACRTSTDGRAGQPRPHPAAAPLDDERRLPPRGAEPGQAAGGERHAAAVGPGRPSRAAHTAAGIPRHAPGRRNGTARWNPPKFPSARAAPEGSGPRSGCSSPGRSPLQPLRKATDGKKQQVTCMQRFDERLGRPRDSKRRPARQLRVTVTWTLAFGFRSRARDRTARAGIATPVSDKGDRQEDPGRQAETRSGREYARPARPETDLLGTGRSGGEEEEERERGRIARP
jgi:hypothetical protein